MLRVLDVYFKLCLFRFSTQEVVEEEVDKEEIDEEEVKEEPERDGDDDGDINGDDETSEVGAKTC